MKQVLSLIILLILLGIKTGDQLMSGTRIPCHSWRDLFKLPILVDR